MAAAVSAVEIIPVQYYKKGQNSVVDTNFEFGGVWHLINILLGGGVGDIGHRTQRTSKDPKTVFWLHIIIMFSRTKNNIKAAIKLPFWMRSSEFISSTTKVAHFLVWHL